MDKREKVADFTHSLEITMKDTGFRLKTCRNDGGLRARRVQLRSVLHRPDPADYGYAKQDIQRQNFDILKILVYLMSRLG